MKASIIVVNKDQRRWLRECIESVACQHIPEGHSLEIILVDGASSDGSWAEVCRHYPGVDFLWLSEPDGGPNEAWNKGLRAATGEIVSFLPGSDRFFGTDVVEIAIRAFTIDWHDTGHAFLCYGWVQVIDEHGCHTPETWCSVFTRFDILDLETYFPIQGCFFSRKLALRVGGMDEKWQSCHTLFFLRMLLEYLRLQRMLPEGSDFQIGSVIASRQDFVACYRRHANARSDRPNVGGIPYALERVAFCKLMAKEYSSIMTRQNQHRLIANAYKREWVSRLKYNRQYVRWLLPFSQWIFHRLLSTRKTKKN